MDFVRLRKGFSLTVKCKYELFKKPMYKVASPWKKKLHNKIIHTALYKIAELNRSIK